VSRVCLDLKQTSSTTTPVALGAEKIRLRKVTQNVPTFLIDHSVRGKITDHFSTSPDSVRGLRRKGREAGRGKEDEREGQRAKRKGSGEGKWSDRRMIPSPAIPVTARGNIKHIII